MAGLCRLRKPRPRAHVRVGAGMGKPKHVRNDTKARSPCGRCEAPRADSRMEKGDRVHGEQHFIPIAGPMCILGPPVSISVASRILLETLYPR